MFCLSARSRWAVVISNALLGSWETVVVEGVDVNTVHGATVLIPVNEDWNWVDLAAWLKNELGWISFGKCSTNKSVTCVAWEGTSNESETEIVDSIIGCFDVCEI